MEVFSLRTILPLGIGFKASKRHPLLKQLHIALRLHCSLGTIEPVNLYKPVITDVQVDNTVSQVLSK